MARRRSRKTPVTTPNKIDVVVKKTITNPTTAVEIVPVSAQEMSWREDVWAMRTIGAMGETVVDCAVSPLIIDVWREDVTCGATTLSLAQWLKCN